MEKKALTFKPSMTLTGEERNELHTAVERAIYNHYVNTLSHLEAEIRRKDEVAKKVRQDKMKEVLEWEREVKERLGKDIEKIEKMKEIFESE